MANKIIHKHSSVITDGKAKLPSVEQLEYGELAVNYASGVETISIKNSDNEIVEFKSSNYVEAIIKELEQVVEDNGFITAASLNELNEKLKKLEESGSGSVIEEIDGIKKEIEDNEYVIATALTDLDDRLYLLGETIDENELVTAAALTQLNEKVKSLEDGNVSGLDEKLVAMEQMIENNSLVAAAALTNLDERTTDLRLRVTDFDYKVDLLDNRLTNVENGGGNVGDLTDYAKADHTHGTITLSGDVTGSGTIGSGTTAINITATVADNSHAHTSANISDSISASSGITSSASGLVQGKAVQAYAAPKTHNHGTITLSGDVTGSATISGTNAVNITATVADNSHAHTSANISDSISTATNITSSATGLVQGKAVHGMVTALESRVAQLEQTIATLQETLANVTAQLANTLTVE